MRHQGRAILALLGPILISQYAYLGNSVIDTLMVGRLGSASLGGVAVGAAIWVPLQMFVAGLLYGALILFSQSAGQNEREKLPGMTQQAAWLSVALACLMTAAVYAVLPHLTRFGTTPDVAGEAARYLGHLAWGMPFIGVAVSVRFYCEGQKVALPATVITLLTLGGNAALNYALIFGAFGFPKMGVAGCGLATAVSMLLNTLLYVGYTAFAPRFAGFRPFNRFHRPQWKPMSEILHIGLPIAFATVCEFLVLSVMAIFISSLGAVPIAAHQITFNFTMILFTVSSSLAVVTSILVGTAHGAGDAVAKKELVTASLILSGSVGIALTAVMFSFSESIATRYTDDPAVIGLCRHLFFVAGFFQFFDAVQVNMNCALRGIGDSLYPFLAILCVYWLLAMPTGYFLAGMRLPFGLDAWSPALGAEGWWTGLTCGIVAIALCMAIRVRKQFFRPDARKM